MSPEQAIAMSDGESTAVAIAVLKVEMRTVKSDLENMIKDVKALQIRWAMILGGAGLLTNLPTILSIFRGHP
jgi:hypothetical protein